MAFNVPQVTAWIASLTFPGVQVLDTNQLPGSVPASACPLLCPDPSGPFITGLAAEWQTFRPHHRSYLARYTLHYALFFAPMGASGTAVYTAYAPLVSAAMSVASVFLTNERPVGADSIRLGADGIPHFEPVSDTAGTWFHGAKYALDVIELVPGN